MNQIKRAAELVGGISKLATVLGVTPQAVAFWRDGKRRMPAEVCPAIERATSGAVTRQDLRPADWKDIWPELVQPAAPAQQEPWDSITERRLPDAPVDRRVSTESVAQAAFKLDQQGAQQQGAGHA